MNKKFDTEILLCPECRSDINIISDEIIQCSNRCNKQYIIQSDIPTFIEYTPDSGKGFEYQWKKKFSGKFEKTTLYGKTKEEEYNQFFSHLRIIPSEINKKNILDAGCGSARMLQLLSKKHNANYYGIDLSSSLYDLKNTDSISLIRGDLLKLPFKDNCFDYIWSGGVLHHTGNPLKGLKQLVRILRPKGRIYIWVYSVNQGVFGKIRMIFPQFYKLPHSILYFICIVLAFPIYIGGLFSLKYHPFSEIQFKLFDHLSPQFRSVHSEDEVINWFKESKLINIHVVINQETGGVGIVGEKQ